MTEADFTPLDEQAIDPLKAMADAHEAAPNIGVTRFSLKHDDSFLVANSYGDISGFSDGFFHRDTRLLSHYVLRIGGRRPVLLGAALSQDGVFLESSLTNASMPLPGGGELAQGSVYVNRIRFLWRDRMFERLAFANYGPVSATLPVAFTIDADFRDIFEVRGMVRPARGNRVPPGHGDRHVRFAYDGLDGVERALQLSFSVPIRPGPLSGEVGLDVRVPRGGRRVIYLEAGPDPAEPGRARYRQTLADAHRAMRLHRRQGATVATSAPVVNACLGRMRSDIALLTSDRATGPYPFAGIPWFSTVFGRDGLITALETLWLDPSLAAGVLRHLAAEQAQATDDFADAEPGKILHEMRGGEMARLGEVPFARYFGAVDTTPLFLMLAAAYARRTGDDALIDALWPALRRAADWVEGRLARDPLGLLSYARARESGLRNQGWKDSHDAVFHADGRLAGEPIRLVEVQGYAFAGLRGLSDLASRRGEAGAADDYARLADRLRERVEDLFWMEDAGFYAMAIDGEGQPCRVRATNAGQLLWTGLPAYDRGRAVAEALLHPDFMSGWGFRTVAKGQPRYNPMSYHNGSVWPHDTAICAAGIAAYLGQEPVVRTFGRILDAAMSFDKSLPELFCGFTRTPGEGPVVYPVACLPQAWAAGAPFLLLEASLGLRLDACAGEITVTNPRLPVGVDTLTIRNLAFRGEEVSLDFTRQGPRVVCGIERPPGSRTMLLVRDHA
jgi:glycogen debranching enzyme